MCLVVDPLPFPTPPEGELLLQTSTLCRIERSEELARVIPLRRVPTDLPLDRPGESIEQAIVDIADRATKHVLQHLEFVDSVDVELFAGEDGAVGMERRVG